VRALFRHVLASRRFEERAVLLYRQNKITGGCYTGIGNEGTSVGTALALGPDDVLVPTQRDMGSHIVRGHDFLTIMRQYLKRGTAQTGGKDGSLHLGVEGSNVVGMISHLGHMLPVAVGVALAERQQGKRTMVLTTIGDGASSLGDFHEALNFAAIQKLPVLFVIVNNQYAYSTPVTLQYACERLSDRAAGYGIPGEQLDGTDAIAVYAASKRAVERGRAGLGPTLLECVTMRLRGHSEHDDFKYVPAELMERWKGGWDPVTRLASYAKQRGDLDDATIAAIDAEIGRDLDAAQAQAESEPPPDPASAVTDIFRLWKPEWTAPSGESWES
jgi:TPP-dependent pyruvate/acetoin dehydrogenase alpha subunit